MFNGVEYVRDICRQKKIPISTLEKDCGFSNGYLNPKKLQKIPYDRALVIADYLDISVNCILHGTEKAPTTEGERPVTFDDFTYAMYEESKELTEENKKKLLEMAQFFRQQQEKDKQK